MKLPAIAIFLIFLGQQARGLPKEDPPAFAGFIDIGGKQHYFDSGEFTWYEALEFCRTLNMNSIAFETQAEEDEVSEWFAENTNYTAFPIWTAANRKAFDDRWFWGTTGADVKEFNWAENFPVQDRNDHACIYFTVPVRGWQDLLCEIPAANYPGMLCE